MKINDDGTEIEMTKGLELALLRVMREFVALQKAQGSYAECWHWGRCYVGNVSSNHPFRFQYGEKGDEPDDIKKQFAVLLEKDDL